MIDQIKNYVCGAIVVSLLTFSAITKWQLYSITKEYSSYKENINDQLQKAINEKKRIEAEQSAKLAKAKLDYSNARRDLDSILDRLRNGEIVPRDESLPLAGSSADSMPGQTTDTRITQVRLKTYKGTCDIDFYSDAMRDNLQCSQLIEFVKQ